MAIGIESKMIRILSFSLGSFLAGLGGALRVHLLSVITPTDMRFHISMNYFINVVVGGTRSFLVKLIAAFLLFFLPELLQFSAADRFIIFGIMVVVIMIFLPQGISSLIHGRRFSKFATEEKARL